MLKEKIKGFIAGVCTTVLLAGAVTAFAANIDVVMSGIKIYWDGIEKTLTDVNGNKVEPMIYEGTTYVPLRAMANLMGKEVDWDQQNMAVIVGEKPVAETTQLADMKDKVIGNTGSMAIFSSIDEITHKEFYLKNKKITGLSNVMLNGNSWPDINIRDGASITFALEGDYSKIVGKAIMPYEEIGSNKENVISFYAVANDGAETKITSYPLKQTKDAIEFEVNVTGVKNLKVCIDKENSSEYEGYVIFYDVAFLGK